MLVALFRSQAFHQTGCLQLLFFDDGFLVNSDLGNGLGFVGGEGGSVKLGQWVGHGGCAGGHGHCGHGSYTSEKMVKNEAVGGHNLSRSAFRDCCYLSDSTLDLRQRVFAFFRRRWRPSERSRGFDIVAY
ncbi:hypothetical protein TIFTF001_007143 [Ficus carica]|uniref:Uncharacterized protein n=1 Tax=Ficus carica TaxID=3494 RepID=A0AA88A5T6_FICCA|nr:hypothetical protein TIFTF001_007143 [Ficus carica]